MRLLLGLALLIYVALPAVAAWSAEFRLLRIDGLYLKWGEPQFGTASEVSYGFAEARASFADAINCGEMAPMAALSRAWGGDPEGLERIAAAAFAMWSREADIDFRRAPAGERPDILIGAQAAPRGIAFANVWHDAAAASGGTAPLTRATICFNPAAPWGAGVGGAPSLDLRTVLAHEIGHAIGLDHPGARGALMGFQPQGPLDRLMPGDVAGGVKLYGVRARGQGARRQSSSALPLASGPVRPSLRSSP